MPSVYRFSEVFAIFPSMEETKTEKSDKIDWAELRRRIAATPIIVPPKHIKRPNRSPESLEKRRIGARIRNKRRYWTKRDEVIAYRKAWEKANPEKVKAKKKRFYEKHKLDPVWMENHRQKNREYKARKRAEKEALKLAAMNQGGDPCKSAQDSLS